MPMEAPEAQRGVANRLNTRVLDHVSVATALPNKRLKLSAPFIYCRIALVNVPARRRSLGAPR